MKEEKNIGEGLIEIYSKGLSHFEELRLLRYNYTKKEVQKYLKGLEPTKDFSGSPYSTLNLVLRIKYERGELK